MYGVYIAWLYMYSAYIAWLYMYGAYIAWLSWLVCIQLSTQWLYHPLRDGSIRRAPLLALCRSRWCKARPQCGVVSCGGVRWCCVVRSVVCGA